MYSSCDVYYLFSHRRKILNLHFQSKSITASHLTLVVQWVHLQSHLISSQSCSWRDLCLGHDQSSPTLLDTNQQKSKVKYSNQTALVQTLSLGRKKAVFFPRYGKMPKVIVLPSSWIAM